MTINSFKYINNNEKQTILFLHGWGCDFTYLEPFSHTIKYANLVFVDLPGFGKNEPLNHYFTLDNYSESILTFLKENNFKIDYIVGHSFGGKLSVLIASRLQIKALILLSPSIYNKPRFLKYYINIYLYKFFKLINAPKFLLNFFGSKDYKTLDNTMKRTMSLVINEDVSSQLASLKIPIIVFFGNDDKITPCYLYKKIKKNCRDSTLIKIKGDHFAYLSNILFVSKVIEKVLNYD